MTVGIDVIASSTWYNVNKFFLQPHAIYIIDWDLCLSNRYLILHSYGFWELVSAFPCFCKTLLYVFRSVYIIQRIGYILSFNSDSWGLRIKNHL